MDKNKDKSKKEKDALKAKKERERRAEERKKGNEKLAKMKAADKAKKQRQKEKAKLQKAKKKEQRAKDKAKTEQKNVKKTAESTPTETQKEIKKPVGKKNNGKHKNVQKPVSKKSAEPVKAVEMPLEESVAPIPVETKGQLEEKSPEPIENDAFVEKAEEKPQKPKKAEKKKTDKENETAIFFKSAGHAINDKVLKKIIGFLKKAFSARYRIVSICVIAVILIGVGVPVAVYSYRDWLISIVANGYNYYGIADTRAKDIEISEEKQLERADETDRHGEKRKFTFFSETEISFDKWYSKGKLIFGSVSQNTCDLVVTIIGEDGKTVLYRSDGILPGCYIPEIRLFEQLKPGEYKCRLFVTGYDSKTDALIGVQYVNIKLIVGGE